MALSSSLAGYGVTIFDRDLLGIASVSAPGFMEHFAEVALEGLSTVPDKVRFTLLETLRAWLDNGGSSLKASQELFVHRNAVNQRLRASEAHTGQKLADPRSIALLTLAYEFDRRKGQKECETW